MINSEQIALLTCSSFCSSPLLSSTSKVSELISVTVQMVDSERMLTWISLCFALQYMTARCVCRESELDLMLPVEMVGSEEIPTLVSLCVALQNIIARYTCRESELDLMLPVKMVDSEKIPTLMSPCLTVQFITAVYMHIQRKTTGWYVTCAGGDSEKIPTLVSQCFALQSVSVISERDCYLCRWSTVRRPRCWCHCALRSAFWDVALLGLLPTIPLGMVLL